MRLFPFGKLDDSVGERVKGLISPAQWHDMRVFFALASSAADLLDYVQAVAERHGQPPARVRVLMALAFQADEGGATPSFFVEKLATSKSNITGLLDGLERDGLLTRVHDMRDRRSTRVRLTAKGRELAQKLLPDLVEAAQAFMAAIRTLAFDIEETASRIEGVLASVRGRKNTT